MAYPKTFLTRPIRRIILALVIGLFFAIAPLLVFYTAGYRYNWQLHRLDQTGVLSIDAAPADAEVWVNGIRITQTMPMRLPDLAPGTFVLEIKKAGYKTWRKDTSIASSQSTYIKNITLFKENLPMPLLTDDTEPATGLWPSPDGNFLIIETATGTIKQFSVFNTQTAARVPLAFSVAGKITVQWSPYDHLFLASASSQGQTTLELYDADKNTHSALLAYPEKMLDANLVWNSTILSKGVSFASNGVITKLTVDHETQAAAYTGDNTPERIIERTDSRMLLKTDTGVAVYRLDAPTHLGGNAIKQLNTPSLLYNASTKEWLAWSPWELWTIYPNGDATLLNRSSEYTVDVSPLDDFGVLLIATNHSLTAFNPGYYVSQGLWQGGTIERIAVNKSTRQIYFLGTVGKMHGIWVLSF